MYPTPQCDTSICRLHQQKLKPITIGQTVSLDNFRNSNISIERQTTNIIEVNNEPSSKTDDVTSNETFQNLELDDSDDDPCYANPYQNVSDNEDFDIQTVAAVCTSKAQHMDTSDDDNNTKEGLTVPSHWLLNFISGLLRRYGKRLQLPRIFKSFFQTVLQ